MMGIKGIAVIWLLFIAIFLITLNISCGQSGSSGGGPVEDEILRYTIYPSTEGAPQVKFVWGASKETVVPPGITSISSRFGGWEGGGGGSVYKPGCEPASESEIYVSSTREPIYSYVKGTVVHVNTGEVNAYGQRVGEVSVRYGRKYAVKHLHITEIQPGIQTGTTIEVGVLLGYTERMGNASFWESEMCQLKSTAEIVAVPLYFYLDASSKNVFNQILIAVGQTSWFHTAGEPTTEAWVPYVGTTEAWADSAKFGIKPDKTQQFDSSETYYAKFGLSWIFN